MDIYQLRLAEERSEKRGLTASIVVALIVHGVLLAVTFPQLYSQELTPETEKKPVFVVQTVKWKPPVVEPERMLKRTKKVPIPDPDPERIEPLRFDDPIVEPEIEMVDDLPFEAPPAPPLPEPEGPIFVYGDVEPPTRIHYVSPRYTEMARKVRLQGVVILQSTIDKEGHVIDIKVLKGLSMGLSEAAVGAVRQWKFEPSTLRGKPVAVYYNLTVRFQLN